MHLAQQPVGEREALAQPGHAVFEGSHVVGDLHDVVEGHAGRLVELEEQQVGQGRLGTLDLAGEHRLAPDVGVEEQVGVRQEGGDTVQPPEASRARSRSAGARRRARAEGRAAAARARRRARSRPPWR